ncbi:MAG: site-specific DNA-methyltransferase [Lachnospiraceae bacterium]|nr:site-specific DNA-methyltransferase [Lachnospiraceae bacterium]
MKFEKGSTNRARELALKWLEENFEEICASIDCGLPEYDDRLDVWRISVKAIKNTNISLGEIQIDRKLTKIVDYTEKNLMLERYSKLQKKSGAESRKKGLFYPAPIPNKVILGDSIKVLENFPPDTAQLVITSPPYFNAKTEYSEYVDYQEYLDFLRKVIVRCHTILSEGRFFVINVSPVLIKRTSRNTSSKRIPIPFDVHKIMDSVGFDFIDDIIWEKPEGAGWNVGRGRRFKADRQPLQYKPVTVTEYVLVYRKRTDKLIDWNIRNHYDHSLVEESKILGDYDVTNIWKIKPGINKNHPAVFPDELVRKVIRYYSFKDDMVLDPFGGSGTVGRIAYEMERRFMLIDREPTYYNLMKEVLSELIDGNVRVDYCTENDFIDEESE